MKTLKNMSIQALIEIIEDLESKVDDLNRQIIAIKDNRKYFEKKLSAYKNKEVSLRNKISKSAIILSESDCPFALEALDVLFKKHL